MVEYILSFRFYNLGFPIATIIMPLLIYIYPILLKNFVNALKEKNDYIGFWWFVVVSFIILSILFLFVLAIYTNNLLIKVGIING